MTYFKNTSTLEDLRKQYKELLKKFHPDNPGGSTESTKEINAEYAELFNLLKNRHDSGKFSHEKTASQNTSYEDMKYNFEEDAMLREMINKVIHISDITIEIIGQWIWLSGNTYPHRKELKEMKFRFAGKQKSWYWHSEAFRKRSNKVLSMSEKRSRYGSTAVHSAHGELLEA
ncbi:MAG: J domain-containing protein [Blautia producta]|nr:J domain-containing protein [Blautia producta]MDU5380726.1 J domain-containing protein [Blautia producta]MDU6882050.1 J domain-containing protein [Blautia producta]